MCQNARFVIICLMAKTPCKCFRRVPNPLVCLMAKTPCRGCHNWLTRFDLPDSVLAICSFLVPPKYASALLCHLLRFCVIAPKIAQSARFDLPDQFIHRNLRSCRNELWQCRQQSFVNRLWIEFTTWKPDSTCPSIFQFETEGTSVHFRSSISVKKISAVFSSIFAFFRRSPRQIPCEPVCSMNAYKFVDRSAGTWTQQGQGRS
jgi:hypothetical protein